MSRTAVFAPLGFCIASKSSAPFSWRRCSSGLPNLPAVPFQVFDEHIDITKMFSGILLLGLNYKIKLWNMVFFFTSYASSYSYAYFVWQDNVYCLKNKQKVFFLFPDLSCVFLCSKKIEILPAVHIYYCIWCLKTYLFSSHFWWSINFSIFFCGNFVQCTGTKFTSSCRVSSADLLFYSGQTSIPTPFTESCSTDYQW